MSITIFTSCHHITGIVLINLFNRFTRTVYSFHCNGIPIVRTNGDRRIAFCVYIVTDGSRLVSPCIRKCTDSNGLVVIRFPRAWYVGIICRSMVTNHNRARVLGLSLITDNNGAKFQSQCVITDSNSRRCSCMTGFTDGDAITMIGVCTIT